MNHIPLPLPCGEQKRQNSPVKCREIVANDLSKAGWSWGCVSVLDAHGRTIWITDAHRDDGKRFILRADEKLTAFLELESASRFCAECQLRKSRNRWPQACGTKVPSNSKHFNRT